MNIDNIREEVLNLVIADRHGIYIPQLFAEFFERANIKESDWKILQEGVDGEDYWDTWNHVLDNYNHNGKILYQDGDLWSIDTTLLEKYSEEEQEEFWESFSL